MSSRRNAALTLLSLPIIAKAVGARSTAIPPLSEAAARIISYTLYAEARGEPLKGKMAVAAVIQTRARRSKTPLTDVCLKASQFSCWNDLHDVPENFITGIGLRHADIIARSDCFGIAWVLMSSDRAWEHLTHFYNPDQASPDWAASLKGKRVIGNHVFGYID